MFRRVFDEGLSQASYLLACDRTRLAAIVDPRRDVDEYVAIARENHLTIAYAIETHVHADFVSGARELAALGARVISGPGASLEYTGPSDLAVADGSTLPLGDIELTMLHTPGHTPEHISVLAREPGQPDRLFTGDLLFVGSVGRPDLLGEAAMLALAGDLYESLHVRLAALPDDVEVWPGHGAGSLCGAGIGSAPSTTLGRERMANPFMKYRSREAFVAAVLGDLPDTPAYFARMKRVNREGPPPAGLHRPVEAPPELAVEEVARAVADGAWLLDLRSAQAFGAGHPAGAVNLQYGAKVGYWAGWLLPADASIALLVDGGSRVAADVRRQLLRVGLDRLAGTIAGGFDAWRLAGLPIRQLPQVQAAELRRHDPASDSLALVDVRSRGEWQAGHVDGAIHIPVHELAARAGEIPRRARVATICEGGYRSSLGGSLLLRHGVDNLVNVLGGMAAWREPKAGGAD